MKRIKWFLISVFLLPTIVLAKGTGTIAVTSTNQVVLGQKITVTVKLSSSTLIGSWQMQLNYDKNYLQLTSTNSEEKGVMMAASSPTGVKSKSYTFTFKALKTGSTKVSVNSYEAYDFNDPSPAGEIELSSSSKTIKIITQQQLEDSYSKDNNLKSLSVEGYSLTPAFNKDTLSYNLTVPEGTTSINVKATPSDSKASVSGDDEVKVSEGINTVNVVVRAENGSEKTYTILVNVIDQNPINVNVNGTPYTVIKLRSNYTCPQLYTESEIEINGFKIPACYNEKINYTLVGLKKEDGTVVSSIYDNNEYALYEEAVGTSLKLVILDYDKKIEGLNKYQETIDGVNYPVFKASDNAKNYVVYGLNVLTGEKDLYNYDTINKTFTLYDSDLMNNLNKLNKTYLYVILAFGGGLFLAIICLFSMNASKKKVVKTNLELKKMIEEKKEKEDNKKNSKKDKKKKKDKKEQNEEAKDKEVVKEEIKEEETKEFYDIFEDDKSKKKR